MRARASHRQGLYGIQSGHTDRQEGAELCRETHYFPPMGNRPFRNWNSDVRPGEFKTRNGTHLFLATYTREKP